MEMLDSKNSLTLVKSEEASPFEGYDIIKMINGDGVDINEDDPYYILQDKEDWSYWYVKYFDNNTEPRHYTEHIMKHLGDTFAKMYNFKTHDSKLISDGIDDNLFYISRADWSDGIDTVPFPKIDEQKDISYYKGIIRKQADAASFDNFCKALLFDVLVQNEDRSAENLFFTKTEDGLVFDFLPDNDIGTEYNILNDIEDDYLLSYLEGMDSADSNTTQVLLANKKVYDEFIEETDIEEMCKVIKYSDFLDQEQKNFLQKKLVAQFQKIKDVDK